MNTTQIETIISYIEKCLENIKFSGSLEEKEIQTINVISDIMKEQDLPCIIESEIDYENQRVNLTYTF